jgi:spore coat assembly protein
MKIGKILHLDGDKKYSEKSYRYYHRLGVNAIVKNIPEYRQPKVVYRLLEVYNPDILVITGHDAMIKNKEKYYDIYNYKNSKYFIETVKEARRFDREKNKNLVIFAGACQSYFEAIISAGANFASSPARILIDFMDPLIVAGKVALTEDYKYITMDDIAYELRDGKKGIDGIGAKGKMSMTK